ncbi:MAG: twin-arginine translocation signal domain-containing protein [Methanobacteriota archaeon]
MEDKPTHVSRRGFLKKTAAGAAAAAALAAAPSLLVVAEKTGFGSDGATVNTPLVAYIRDASKGEIVLMVGAREVVRRDPNLARWLMALAQGG